MCTPLWRQSYLYVCGSAHQCADWYHIVPVDAHELAHWVMSFYAMPEPLWSVVGACKTQLGLT